MKKGEGSKDSRQITMSVAALISPNESIGEDGGLPRLLSIPLC
jgi:hypothetical protein